SASAGLLSNLLLMALILVWGALSPRSIVKEFLAQAGRVFLAGLRGGVLYLVDGRLPLLRGRALIGDAYHALRELSSGPQGCSAGLASGVGHLPVGWHQRAAGPVSALHSGSGGVRRLVELLLVDDRLPAVVLIAPGLIRGGECDGGRVHLPGGGAHIRVTAAHVDDMLRYGAHAAGLDRGVFVTRYRTVTGGHGGVGAERHARCHRELASCLDALCLGGAPEPPAKD